MSARLLTAALRQTPPRLCAVIAGLLVCSLHGTEEAIAGHESRIEFMQYLAEAIMILRKNLRLVSYSYDLRVRQERHVVAAALREHRSAKATESQCNTLTRSI